MKQKGFTLIELLAVIIILAVVALIGTPMIINIIEEAKVSAFKDSVSNVVSTVDLYTETDGDSLKDGFNINDMTFSHSDLKYGKVQLVNNELIAINISNGEYCANGELGNLTITEGECDTTVPVQPYVDNVETIAASIVYTLTEVEETESGILNYEYVITNDPLSVDENTEATNSSESADLTITEESDSICFRIIAVSGKVGGWSCVTNYVDVTPPVITITEENIEEPTFTLTDKSLIGYQIMTTETVPTTWETISGVSYNGSYLAPLSGTYYVYAKDSLGNISHTSFIARTPYREAILNGAYPVIGDGMIPVTIANNGTVTYADLFEEWYSYTNKEWANIVILNDGYSYSIGDTIPEDAIESYLVWVPRYRYQLFNTTLYTDQIEDTTAPDNTRTISIVFEDKDTAVSNGSTVNSWLTHPAFTSFDSNGMWVGKFETGFRGESQYGHNTSDSSYLVIKPTYTPWDTIMLSNAWFAAYNYNRTNDSHMMKNMEWGAVAYLSQTIYGKNDEIWNNPYTKNTGCAGSTASPAGSTSSVCAYEYNTTNGFETTTTGNIYGIYDMAAGHDEYMASYASATGTFWYTSSTITSYDAKYTDIYAEAHTYDYYDIRKLGDATGEMGSFYYDDTYYSHSGWYNEQARSLYSSFLWFTRGGGAGNAGYAGIFSFKGANGDDSASYGFRTVLTPQ